MLNEKDANNQEADNEDLHHAGDKAFKATMKVKETALEYVENFFPELYRHLEEKSFLRSLFLAYTYYEKKDNIENILFETFKFFKHHPDRLDFFQLMFVFLSKEGYLSNLEIYELFNRYLSPPQKESVMTTYQIWKREGLKEGRQEGRQEGEIKKAHLMILRGKWKGASADFLADQSELPYSEVENLLKGYEIAYEFWQNNNINKKPIASIENLSDQEVQYLFDLFNKEQK